ncbi:trafficking regulator of GLUT4 1-like [Tachysurus ichikawai]
MDPSTMSEKSEKTDQPPAYQADMGYPSVPAAVPAQGVYPPAQGYPVAQGVYPPVQGYGVAQGVCPPAQGYGAGQYGAQPYPGQAAVTVQPTVFVTPSTQINPIPDYLGYSIFTLLCCCLPLGIAALIYSINTRDANMMGNRDMAMKNSRVSRLLNNIALGLGILAYVIGIILIIISASTVWKLSNYN